MSEQMTIRRLVQEEMRWPPARDLDARIEARIHHYIRTFTDLHKRLATDNQEFHVAREIQKLEDRLLLSPAPTETWTEKEGA